MTMENLTAFCLQIAIVLAAGALAIWALRLKSPIWKLRAWQTLLAASLLLPAVEPWQPTESAVSIAQSDARPIATTPPNRTHRLPIRQILIAGTILRLAWFAAGLARLQRYRRRSTPLGIHPPIPVRADIRTSPDLASPVTFGFFHPVILLPDAWKQNEAILYHELIHVRRHDWLFMAAEEFLRALLWFHPLIWFAIGQIQLAREQAVDREAVALTQSREHYLQTLLAIAASNSGLAIAPDLAPAPLFLKKRQLQIRVASLLQEVTMSKFRLNATLAALLSITLAAGWLAVRSFPLQAAEQESAQPTRLRIGGNVQAAKITKKVNPKYPASAKENRIQGLVTLSVIIDKEGKVKEVELIGGHPDLADAAISAVRQWEYSTTLLNGNPVEVATQVDVNFTLTR